MIRAFSIVRIVSILLTFVWLLSIPVLDAMLCYERLLLHLDRSGASMLVLEKSIGDFSFGVEFVGSKLGPDEEWLNWPRLAMNTDSFAVYLPHWLTNLVVWSLFFILWRKTRKPPKGHCQRCGYDLTGNESGHCPECNVEAIA